MKEKEYFFQNMETDFPVWSWMLQEPEVRDDQLKH